MKNIFKSRALPVTLAIAALVVAGFAYFTLQSKTEAEGVWFDTEWQYRKQITIDNLEVSGAHTNFPMLFSVTDPDLADTANGGGVASSTAGDILFVDWEGNKIDHEIEKYTNTSGELVAWVEMPFVSSTSTRAIHIYYGNASASYQPTNAATWNSNYTGVWHLGDGDSTATGFYKDSKSTNNGTLTDADGDSTQATGKIGSAFDFNGDADTIEFGTGPKPTLSSPWSMSAWASFDTTGNFPGFASFYDPANSTPHVGAGLASSAADVKILTGGETPGDGSVLTSGLLYHLVLIYNSSQLCIYVNGSQDYCVTPSGSNWQSGTDFHAGREGRTALGFKLWDGIVDELRVSNIERNGDWVATEYSNQNNPSSFYSYDSQEQGSRAAETSSLNVRGGFNVRGGVKIK